MEGFQQRLLAYMYLALGSLGTPLHLGGAEIGEQSPDQRAHFFCYHFDTFAGLVIWKVLRLKLYHIFHCALYECQQKAVASAMAYCAMSFRDAVMHNAIYCASCRAASRH